MSLIQFRSCNPFKEAGLTPFWVDQSFRNAEGFAALDISEEENSYTIKADLPGIKKEDVHVSFEDGVLTISGERKEEAEQKDKQYHRVERSYGAFARSINLGHGVDADRVNASYKDGVLEITVAKSEKAKPKAIEVKVA